MTQNTEQNMRTRKQQIEDAYLNDGDFTLFQEFDRDDFEAQLHEAEARGAEEQRRKDGAGQEPRTCNHCGGTGEEPGAYYLDGSPYSCSVCDGSGVIYLRPANVAALEAEIASLKEAEQLARADAEASKARVRKLESYLRRIDYWSHEERGSTDEQRVACVRNLISRAALTREGGV